jgi:hypothetical protein
MKTDRWFFTPGMGLACSRSPALSTTWRQQKLTVARGPNDVCMPDPRVIRTSVAFFCAGGRVVTKETTILTLKSCPRAHGCTLVGSRPARSRPTSNRLLRAVRSRRCPLHALASEKLPHTAFLLTRCRRRSSAESPPPRPTSPQAVVPFVRHWSSSTASSFHRGPTH